MIEQHFEKYLTDIAQFGLKKSSLTHFEVFLYLMSLCSTLYK